MTAATVLDRPSTGTSACRFPTWCNGSCALDSHVTGDRNHFSDQRSLQDAEFWNTIAVDLYGYEAPGADSPVVVCLAVGDGGVDIASTNFTAAQSRELGNILIGLRPENFRFDDALIWHHAFDDHRFPETHIDLRQPRDRRRGGRTEMAVEVSIRDGASRRARLRLLDAWTLGHWLVESADQADSSNREQGLVGA